MLLQAYITSYFKPLHPGEVGGGGGTGTKVGWGRNIA